MSGLFSNLLEPLDKRAWLYFYLLSALFLFLFIITILGGIIFLIRRRKEITFRVMMSGLVILFNTFLAYFINRLFYSMCYKSLN